MCRAFVNKYFETPEEECTIKLSVAAAYVNDYIHVVANGPQLYSARPQIYFCWWRCTINTASGLKLEDNEMLPRVSLKSKLGKKYCILEHVNTYLLLS